MDILEHLKNKDLKMSFYDPVIKDYCTPIKNVKIIADEILKGIKKIPEVKKGEVVGSIRRNCLNVKDIDIAIESNNKNKTKTDIYNQYPTKNTKKTSYGVLFKFKKLVVKIYIFNSKEYWAGLIYRTGSVSFIKRLELYSRKKGTSLNSNLRNEKDFFNKLKIPYHAPVLRENIKSFNIDFNKVVTSIHDYVGDLSFRYEKNSFKRTLNRLKKLGFKYAGFKIKHKELEKIGQTLNLNRYKSPIALWFGTVIKMGNKTPKSIYDFDYCFIKPPKDFSGDYLKYLSMYIDIKIPKILINLNGGNLLNRYNWERIFKFCKNNNIILGISCNSKIDYFPHNLIFLAKELGNKFILNGECEVSNILERYKTGHTNVIKGLLEKGDIINTRSFITQKQVNKKGDF